MLDALVFADEAGAGDGPVVDAALADRRVTAVEGLAERLEAGDGGGREPAVLELLDAVGDAALEVSAVPPGRLAFEELAPLRLEVLASAWF